MSIIALPTLVVPKQTWGQRRFDLESSSGDTGSGQVRVLAPPRWMATIMSNEGMTDAEAAEWQALILSLRGRVNQLAMHNYSSPAPRGTYRGAPTVQGLHPAGSTTLQMIDNTQGSATLKKGDWLGVNQDSATRQLVHVQADATAGGGGSITVTIEPALRVQVLSTTPVVWDKPTALFRQRNAESQWSHDGASRGSYSLDMIESWEG